MSYYAVRNGYLKVTSLSSFIVKFTRHDSLLIIFQLYMMFFLSKTVVFAMWLQKRCQSPSTYFYNNIQSNSIIYSLYSIRMSQYIKEVNLQGQLVFRMAPPEIVKPKIKRYVRSSTLENLFNLSGETKMLDRACNRYSLI